MAGLAGGRPETRRALTRVTRLQGKADSCLKWHIPLSEIIPRIVYEGTAVSCISADTNSPSYTFKDWQYS